MKTIQLITLLATIFIFMGCNAKYKRLSNNLRTSEVSITGKIIDINIIDERTYVSGEELNVPTVTIPGQSDRISPVLTEELINHIENQIIYHFTGDDIGFNVNCYVLIGYQEFKARVFSEKEYVRFDVKIELLNTENEVLSNCNSSSYLERKSMDADKEFMDKMFENVIITSISECFDKIEIPNK